MNLLEADRDAEQTGLEHNYHYQIHQVGEDLYGVIATEHQDGYASGGTLIRRYGTLGWAAYTIIELLEQQFADEIRVHRTIQTVQEGRR